jgi:outer membrane lipoprotein SlyB
VVVAIRSVKVPGAGTGVGVVAGGVVGGVIGNQIGGGSGRDAARVIGAIGGAVAGHEIEKQARRSLRYQVDVRLDSGATRTLNLATAPAVGVGERVRIDGGTVLPA